MTGSTSIASRTGQKPKQIIILTHEAQFLRELCHAGNDRTVRYLKVAPDGLTAEGRKKSTLAHCNVHEEFLEADEIKRLKKIKLYAENNEAVPDGVRGDCRLVIEAVFKIKYFPQLEAQILDRSKGVRSYVEKLCELSVPGYDDAKRQKLTRLFNDLHVPHHADVAGPVEMSAGDVRSVLRDTLQELQTL